MFKILKKIVIIILFISSINCQEASSDIKNKFLESWLPSKNQTELPIKNKEAIIFYLTQFLKITAQTRQKISALHSYYRKQFEPIEKRLGKIESLLESVSKDDIYQKTLASKQFKQLRKNIIEFNINLLAEINKIENPSEIEPESHKLTEREKKLVAATEYRKKSVKDLLIFLTAKVPPLEKEFTKIIKNSAAAIEKRKKEQAKIIPQKSLTKTTPYYPSALPYWSFPTEPEEAPIYQEEPEAYNSSEEPVSIAAPKESKKEEKKTPVRIFPAPAIPAAAPAIPAAAPAMPAAAPAMPAAAPAMPAAAPAMPAAVPAMPAAAPAIPAAAPAIPAAVPAMPAAVPAMPAAVPAIPAAQRIPPPPIQQALIPIVRPAILQRNIQEALRNMAIRRRLQEEERQVRSEERIFRQRSEEIAQELRGITETAQRKKLEKEKAQVEEQITARKTEAQKLAQEQAQARAESQQRIAALEAEENRLKNEAQRLQAEEQIAQEEILKRKTDQIEAEKRRTELETEARRHRIVQVETEAAQIKETARVQAEANLQETRLKVKELSDEAAKIREEAAKKHSEDLRQKAELVDMQARRILEKANAEASRIKEKAQGEIEGLRTDAILKRKQAEILREQASQEATEASERLRNLAKTAEAKAEELISKANVQAKAEIDAAKANADQLLRETEIANETLKQTTSKQAAEQAQEILANAIKERDIILKETERLRAEKIKEIDNKLYDANQRQNEAASLRRQAAEANKVAAIVLKNKAAIAEEQALGILDSAQKTAKERLSELEAEMTVLKAEHNAALVQDKNAVTELKAKAEELLTLAEKSYKNAEKFAETVSVQRQDIETLKDGLLARQKQEAIEAQRLQAEEQIAQGERLALEDAQKRITEQVKTNVLQPKEAPKVLPEEAQQLRSASAQEKLIEKPSGRTIIPKTFEEAQAFAELYKNLGSRGIYRNAATSAKPSIVSRSHFTRTKGTGLGAALGLAAIGTFEQALTIVSQEPPSETPLPFPQRSDPKDSSSINPRAIAIWLIARTEQIERENKRIEAQLQKFKNEKEYQDWKTIKDNLLKKNNELLIAAAEEQQILNEKQLIEAERQKLVEILNTKESKGKSKIEDIEKLRKELEKIDQTLLEIVKKDKASLGKIKEISTQFKTLLTSESRFRHPSLFEQSRLLLDKIINTITKFESIPNKQQIEKDINILSKIPNIQRKEQLKKIAPYYEKIFGKGLTQEQLITLSNTQQKRKEQLKEITKTISLEKTFGIDTKELKKLEKELIIQQEKMNRQLKAIIEAPNKQKEEKQKQIDELTAIIQEEQKRVAETIQKAKANTEVVNQLQKELITIKKEEAALKDKETKEKAKEPQISWYKKATEWAFPTESAAAKELRKKKESLIQDLNKMNPPTVKEKEDPFTKEENALIEEANEYINKEALTKEDTEKTNAIVERLFKIESERREAARKAEEESIETPTSAEEPVERLTKPIEQKKEASPLPENPDEEPGAFKYVPYQP